MIKTPQNIIKISSQHTDGDYSQMVFNANESHYEDLVERFQNFLRGIGYAIPYKHEEKD